MQILRTGKLTDKAILDLFEAIEKEFGYKEGSVKFDDLALEYKDDSLQELIGSTPSYAITSAYIAATDYKFSITYKRTITTFTSQDVSPYFDEIVIQAGSPNNYPGQIQPTLEDRLILNILIRKHIVIVSAPSIGEEANGAVQLLQAQMSGLSSQYQTMLTGIDKRRTELDKEQKQKLKEIAEERNSQLLEVRAYEEEARAKITASQEDLERRTKELDDRDHRHVRRDLRANINQDIKDRLSKTLVRKQAAAIRWAIFALSITGACALAWVSYEGFKSFSSLLNSNAISFNGTGEIISGSTSNILDTKLYALLIKSVLSSIGAIGFLAYAISWLRRLYYDDVNMERELERYAYDINRASWAIETMMDIQNANGQLPPETWIVAVCNNLFANDNLDGDDKREASPLELLLSSSAKVEIGPDGSRFEVGPSGARKLAKKIANDD